MSNTKQESWLKRFWKSALFTVIIGPITATALYDYFKEKPILSTLGFILKSIWLFILSVLNFQLRLWWIAIGLSILYLLLWVINKFNEYRQAEPKKPGYALYTSENYNNWLWKWDWVWNAKIQNWQIHNLHPYCKRCDIELVDRSLLTRELFECPRCGKSYDGHHRETDNEEAVEKIILDNVRKGKYKT